MTSLNEKNTQNINATSNDILNSILVLEHIHHSLKLSTVKLKNEVDIYNKKILAIIEEEVSALELEIRLIKAKLKD